MQWLTRLFGGGNPNRSIHQAAYDGDIAKVGRLLERGADIDARDENGCTPLHRALRGSHDARGDSTGYQKVMDTIELLLDRGASVSIEDNRGRDALQWAHMASNDEAASMIARQIGLREL